MTLHTWLGSSLLLLMLSCGSTDSDTSTPTSTHPAGGNTTEASTSWNLERVAESDGGSWIVRYEPTPDPIPIPDNFTIRLTVERDGMPDPAVEVGFDATMPEHNHGMNTTAVVTPNKDGTFEITGLQFHMTGHWRLHVELDADVSETAYFDVECCD